MAFVQESVLRLHEGPVKTIDVAGDRLVAGGTGGAVQLVSLGSEPRIETEVRVPGLVNSVRLSPDGKLVGLGSRDHLVRVWDPAAGGIHDVGEHDNWVMSVAWSDDGRELVTGSEDGTLRTWNAAGGELRRVDLGYPANAVDRRGDVVAVANGNRKLYLVDASTGDVTREVRGAEQLLWSVAISPDARRVAWTGRDRWIRVLDLEGAGPNGAGPSGAGPNPTAPNGAEPNGAEVLEIPAHRGQVWSVAWNASGDRLVSASADGTAAIWSAGGEPLERVSSPAWVRAARLTGDRLVLTGEDGRLRVFHDDGRAARLPDPITVPKPPRACAHWDPQVEETSKRVCEGGCGSLESLRLCVTCGHVGCCESQWAHATKHWVATGSPEHDPDTPRTVLMALVLRRRRLRQARGHRSGADRHSSFSRTGGDRWMASSMTQTRRKAPRLGGPPGEPSPSRRSGRCRLAKIVV